MLAIGNASDFTARRQWLMATQRLTDSITDIKQELLLILRLLQIHISKEEDLANLLVFAVTLILPKHADLLVGRRGITWDRGRAKPDFKAPKAACESCNSGFFFCLLGAVNHRRKNTKKNCRQVDGFVAEPRPSQ